MQRLGVLFGSETRAKLLKVLFSAREPLNLTQLVSLASVDAGGAHRELAKLVKVGIVLKQGTSGVHTYQISTKNPFYPGLSELFQAGKNPYFVFEEYPIGYPQMLCTYFNVHAVNALLERSSLKSRISKSMTVYNNAAWTALFSGPEFRALSKEIVNKIMAGPDWGLANVADVIEKNTALFTLSNEIAEKDYSTYSNKELAGLLKKYFTVYETAHVSGWVQNSSDFGQMLFSNTLISLLKNKANGKINANEAFSKLTTPNKESFMQKEHENLLKLLAEAQHEPALLHVLKTMEPGHLVEKLRRTPFGQAVAAHAKTFGFLGYGYVGPPWREDYFYSILSSLTGQEADAGKLLKENAEKAKKLAEEQARLVAELGLNENERKVFEVAKGFVFSKGYRKDAMCKYYYCMEHVYAEVGRRLHLSVSDMRFVYPQEFDDLLDGKIPSELLRARREYSLCESTGKYADDLYLEGEKARDYYARIAIEEEEKSEEKMLEGTCACPGKARGRVKIINHASEMTKMQNGDVLVSVATMPELVPAMKKASAIVTDAGGITCHAAIVSRELNIPCVVGTKKATKILKDGYLIDVDAAHGTIKLIEKS